MGISIQILNQSTQINSAQGFEVHVSEMMIFHSRWFSIRDVNDDFVPQRSDGGSNSANSWRQKVVGKGALRPPNRDIHQSVRLFISTCDAYHCLV